MRRAMTVVLLALASSCVDSQNISIEIPFALLSSDEIQEPQPGQPCDYTPVTQSGGLYRSSGLLELDPNLNPSAGYQLVLQVENYLSQVTNTDSNGTPLSGPNANDFLVTDAIVQYIPQQSYLEPGMPSKSKFLTSGDVRTGGSQSATAVSIETLSPDAISAMTANLQNLASTQGIVGPGGDVVLEVYLEGTLGSGEPVVSGTLYFPLHVCVDCGGADPLNCVGVTVGTMVPVGRGPCCGSEGSVPQDFIEQCAQCGLIGEPACAPPQIPGGITCGQDSDCVTDNGEPLGMPHCVGGICNAFSDSECQAIYGAGSQCLPPNGIPSTSGWTACSQNTPGTCTGGCSEAPVDINGSPTTLVPTSAPAEQCPYLNAAYGAGALAQNVLGSPPTAYTCEPQKTTGG
jgi:hypothetical protein